MPRHTCVTLPLRLPLFQVALAIALGLVLALPAAAPAQTAADPAGVLDEPLPPIRTDSPRQVLSSFLRFRDQLERTLLVYARDKTRAGADRVRVISDKLIALIDLEEVPAASRRETGITTVGSLLDIFGRITLPNLDAVPDVAAFPHDGQASFRIPETPLRIVRIETGPRAGEFLFDAMTVTAAPRFRAGIEGIPLRSALPIESWSALTPQVTGHMIPAWFTAAMPSGLKRLWFDTPLWKVIAIVALLALTAAAVLLLGRALRRIAVGGRVGTLAIRLVSPLLLIGATFAIQSFIAEQINPDGAFARATEMALTVAVYLSGAWAFWLAAALAVELLILSPAIPEESLDANLMRLLAGLAGLVGVVVIVAFGGQAVGLPILSVLAGLGIGGLAVALALRPTLENLIGGVILYIDRPVRVGDFCSFGDQTGTVETIGVRSTKLRALDRTLISIPNAQFADMQIVNWAECDQMLIRETIGVRYETEPDQLRYLLARLREMLHAHPRINGDTVRVRFAGYGESALKIDIRVYAETREWNDFFAIREDVFLRIYDIVSEAGSGFAFPSTTLYLARDGGLDPDAAGAARQRVAEWRRRGRLPFPRLRREDIERLSGTLDYPPRGSAQRLDDDPGASAEPLSAPERGSEPLSAEDAAHPGAGAATAGTAEADRRERETDRPR